MHALRPGLCRWLLPQVTPPSVQASSARRGFDALGWDPSARSSSQETTAAGQANQESEGRSPGRGRLLSGNAATRRNNVSPARQPGGTEEVVAEAIRYDESLGHYWQQVEVKFSRGCVNAAGRSEPLVDSISLWLRASWQRGSTSPPCADPWMAGSGKMSAVEALPKRLMDGIAVHMDLDRLRRDGVLHDDTQDLLYSEMEAVQVRQGRWRWNECGRYSGRAGTACLYAVLRPRGLTLNIGGCRAGRIRAGRLPGHGQLRAQGQGAWQVYRC